MTAVKLYAVLIIFFLNYKQKWIVEGAPEKLLFVRRLHFFIAFFIHSWGQLRYPRASRQMQFLLELGHLFIEQFI